MTNSFRKRFCFKFIMKVGNSRNAARTYFVGAVFVALLNLVTLSMCVFSEVSHIFTIHYYFFQMQISLKCFLLAAFVAFTAAHGLYT